MNVRCCAFDLGTSNLGIGVVDRDGGVTPQLRARAAKYVTTAKNAGEGRTTDDDLRRALELREHIASALDVCKPSLVVYEAYRVYADPIAPRLRKLVERWVELFSWGPAGTRPEHITSASLIATAASGRGFVQQLAGLLDEGYEILQAAGDVRGRGDAAKVLVVQGIVLAEAASRKIPVRTFLPSDLRERFHPRDKDGKLSKSSSKRDHKQRTEQGVRAVLVGLDEVLQSAGISGYKVEHISDALGHAILGCESYVSK